VNSLNESLPWSEALRRLLVGRAAMQRAAEWLDRRPQLGREVFGRGGGVESALAVSRVADITDLFRACLLALRMRAVRLSGTVY